MDKPALSRLRDDCVIDTRLCDHPMVFHATWGLFSPRSIDEGTELLLEYINIAEDADCIDLGCGYGAIGLTLAKLAPQGVTHLIDKDFVAVEYCTANARRNGVTNTEIYLSNGFAQVPADARFDVVVTNLPAKSGKELYYLFFHDALRHMNPGAEIYIVTVNGLRQFVKRVFNEVFGNYQKLKQGKTYTVARAIKPD